MECTFPPFSYVKPLLLYRQYVEPSHTLTLTPKHGLVSLNGHMHVVCTCTPTCQCSHAMRLAGYACLYSHRGYVQMCVCVCVPPSRSKEPLQDSIISTYEEHEDSVYAVEWSSADPWLFASLSYDGRLVINRVPRALKYRILL